MRKFSQQEETILDSLIDVQMRLEAGESLHSCTVRNIDFREQSLDWMALDTSETTFLGCQLTGPDELVLREKGAVLYPRSNHLPYNPYRNQLYTWRELIEGFDEENDESLDYRIYKHFDHSRYNPCIKEALNQRIHDHAIDSALRDLLSFDNNGMTQRKCVGIMGGHGTMRTDPFFRKVVQTAKLLTEAGYYVASGGGPGIMEAANLGAWLAGKNNEAIDEALEMLAVAPHYSDKGFHAAAHQVLESFPDGAESLAIPTWFYGHEPSNLFGTHIAKYFSNSIREDTLLAVSLHGVVFAPGSAGTTQEIFMDATQNHYGTLNFYSPMIFLGEKRYEIDTLIFPLLRQLSYGRDYHDMLYLTGEPGDITGFLQKHPPRKK